MKKPVYIPLWSTRFLLLQGIPCFLFSYWACYAYPKYHHLWYYWPFFALFIGFYGVNLCHGISLLRLEAFDITVFRLFSQRTYHFATVQYGQKKQVGSGHYSFSSWPITIYGQITTKDRTLKNHQHTYLSGSLNLKLFQKNLRQTPA